MTKEFLRDTIRIKPIQHPVTPFMRAQQEWDDRLGASVVRAKNWRLAFFASIILSLLLGLCVLLQVRQHKVIPIVVALDRERGEPRVIGRVPEAGYVPQVQEIKFFLMHFITLVRSVPSDPVLIKQNWLKAYEFLRRDAANILNDITNKDAESPLKKIGERTVLVQPIAVTQVAGTNSYQVRWEEAIYNGQGNVIDRYVMNGVFTVEIEPPTTEKTLSHNPLGLYIKNFQWNRELQR